MSRVLARYILSPAALEEEPPKPPRVRYVPLPRPTPEAIEAWRRAKVQRAEEEP